MSLGTKTNPIQIVFLGDSGVGKTCLIHRIIHKNFDYKMTPTQNVTKIKHKIEIDGKEIYLTFVDFSGGEKIPRNLKDNIAGSHIVLYFYEFGNTKTFENLKEFWYYYATEVLGLDVFGEIIATKMDLLISPYADVYEGSRFAEQMGYEFISISTEKEIKIKNIIEDVVKKFLEKGKSNSIDNATNNNITNKS